MKNLNLNKEQMILAKHMIDFDNIKGGRKLYRNFFFSAIRINDLDDLVNKNLAIRIYSDKKLGFHYHLNKETIEFIINRDISNQEHNRLIGRSENMIKDINIKVGDHIKTNKEFNEKMYEPLYCEKILDGEVLSIDKDGLITYKLLESTCDFKGRFNYHMFKWQKESIHNISSRWVELK